MAASGIVVDGVWKRFHRGELHDSLRDLIPAIARRVLRRGLRRDQLGEGDFWALRDVSFQVKPGEALGILGPNGAGKSTMLKILSGILRPDQGRVRLTGRVGALIEVAAGFHPDLTGRENIYLQGAIIGMPRPLISAKFDEIVGLSGVGEFLDTPVKRYSSGMNARLGFSIAVHLEPQVLLIDEVLAVGDHTFQEKAFNRLSQLVRSGVPVVVVSHQLNRIAELCQNAILLRNGSVAKAGTASDCIAAYLTPEGVGGIGADRVRIQALRLEQMRLGSGERVWGHAVVEDTGFEPSLYSVGLSVRSVQTGRELYAITSDGVGLKSPPAQGTYEVTFSLQMNVEPGLYTLESWLWDSLTRSRMTAGPTQVVEVRGVKAFFGDVQLNATMSAAPRP